VCRREKFLFLTVIEPQASDLCLCSLTPTKLYGSLVPLRGLIRAICDVNICQFLTEINNSTVTILSIVMSAMTDTSVLNKASPS
jgi:hypothetical protein